jgi:hypothetical protein
MQDLILKTPTGTTHFLRTGAGAHGTKTWRTQRQAFRQNPHKED